MVEPLRGYSSCSQENKPGHVYDKVRRWPGQREDSPRGQVEVEEPVGCCATGSIRIGLLTEGDPESLGSGYDQEGSVTAIVDQHGLNRRKIVGDPKPREADQKIEGGLGSPLEGGCADERGLSLFYETSPVSAREEVTTAQE